MNIETHIVSDYKDTLNDPTEEQLKQHLDVLRATLQEKYHTNTSRFLQSCVSNVIANINWAELYPMVSIDILKMEDFKP